MFWRMFMKLLRLPPGSLVTRLGSAPAASRLPLDSSRVMYLSRRLALLMLCANINLLSDKSERLVMRSGSKLADTSISELSR